MLWEGNSHVSKLYRFAATQQPASHSWRGGVDTTAWRIILAKVRMMSKVECSGRTPYSPGPTPR